MTDPIKINAFTGMNNIKEKAHLFVQKGVAQPRVILNADVNQEGRLIKRDGFEKVISLTNGHSEWSDGKSVHLVMDGSTLKRIQNDDTAIDIEAISCPTTDMYYAEVADKVYLSNKYWNGIFNPESDSVSDWGITLPPGPMLSSASGNLPAGTYHVCFTTVSGDDISGNGPVAQIELTSEGGIAISNRASSDIVWCTDANGGTLYRVGAVDTIVSMPTVEPLPSFMCSPPPFMEHICHAFGRMWGAVGNILYYSESFHLDWWKFGANFFNFETDIVMVAKTYTGLFIGCEDRTFSLLGTQPEEMQQKDVGVGPTPGTLSYCNDIIELGDTISPPEKKHQAVPVWACETGIVAGNPVGRLFSLTQEKVRFFPGKKGASLYRNKDGQFQYLTTFPKGGVQEGIGMQDEVTVEVIRNGKVFTESSSSSSSESSSSSQSSASSGLSSSSSESSSSSSSP